MRSSPAHCASQLSAGVTTVRDLGDRRFCVVQRRDTQPATRASEPTIVASGPPLTSTAGHCHFLGGEVSGTAEIIRAVAERVERGVDVVKVMASGGVNTPGSDVMRTQFTTTELQPDRGSRARGRSAGHCARARHSGGGAGDRGRGRRHRTLQLCHRPRRRAGQRETLAALARQPDRGVPHHWRGPASDEGAAAGDQGDGGPDGRNPSTAAPGQARLRRPVAPRRRAPGVRGRLRHRPGQAARHPSARRVRAGQRWIFRGRGAGHGDLSSRTGVRRRSQQRPTRCGSARRPARCGRANSRPTSPPCSGRKPCSCKACLSPSEETPQRRGRASTTIHSSPAVTPAVTAEHCAVTRREWHRQARVFLEVRKAGQCSPKKTFRTSRPA